MGNIAATIQVERKARDGWFVYTCDQLPGLYVASQNDRVAYDDLILSIEQWFALNLNTKVAVRHAVGFDTFYQQLMAGQVNAELSRRAQSAVRDRTDDLMQQGSFGFIIEAAPAALCA